METKEGWAATGRLNRFHYFQDTLSLCGRLTFKGALKSDAGHYSHNDCPACRKQLEKSRVKPQ